MLQLLAKETVIKVDGKWRALRAVLVTTKGGRKVIYLDRDGHEVYSEPLCKSKFKVTTVIDKRIVRGGSVVSDDLSLEVGLDDLSKL
jgi:hypothetical protein